MSSETVIYTAVGLYMREGGVLKLARLCSFPRRRTNRTFAAPPVGQIYRTK